MRILGIETSCDETAAAIVQRNSDGVPELLSNTVFSQIKEHEAFGGVVPEIAARAHLSKLDGIIRASLEDASLELGEIDGIGVTAGPGLIGGLVVGVMTAKALAASLDIPYLAVNHLEGHALTARLSHNIEYPYLLLLVSGGHTQIIKVNELGNYDRLATTIDDAAGEAFDKTAKLLGLGFPGGPMVERHAENGDPKRFSLPHPLKGQDTLNMSFSGLKTAIRNAAQEAVPLEDKDISDLCAGLQSRVADVLADRCERAMRNYGDDTRTLVVAGGVAANAEIRSRLDAMCAGQGWNLIAPPLSLCTDNAAMIAWAALERMERGEYSSYDFSPRSRWPLDEKSATMVGSGRRGAKV